MCCRFAICGGSFEGSAASAASGSIGIVQPEACAGKVVGVIKCRAPDKRGAPRIDNYLHPCVLRHRIVRGRLIERHAVLQSGTATLLNKDAQTLAGLALLRDQRLQVLRRGIGDRDHKGAT